MGWFGGSEYSKLKKMVDDIPVMQKASMTLQGLVGNTIGMAPIAVAIKKASSEGKITTEQADELIKTIQRKGLGKS